MAISPTLNICNPHDNCTKISVKDNTGRYDASNNTGGYGTPNDDYSDVTAVTLEIQDSAGTTIQTETLTTQLNTITTQPDVVTYDDITLASYSDGLHTFIYKVTTGNGTFKYKKTVLLTCNAQCAIDKLWADVADKSCGNCDCDLKDAIDNALQAQALLEGLKNGTRCNDSTAVSEILSSIDRLTDFDACSCD